MYISQIFFVTPATHPSILCFQQHQWKLFYKETHQYIYWFFLRFVVKSKTLQARKPFLTIFIFIFGMPSC